MISENVKLLFSDFDLLSIERTIASNIGCNLYRDSLPVLSEIIAKEIELSGFSISEIEAYISRYSYVIIEFAAILFENKKYRPQTLSTGIAISYTIYLLLLKNKEPEYILSYLNLRRIKNSRSFLELLLKLSFELVHFL
jgi:hypothetical protein